MEVEYRIYQPGNLGTRKIKQGYIQMLRELNLLQKKYLNVTRQIKQIRILLDLPSIRKVEQ
jgi:hypothetical protein